MYHLFDQKVYMQNRFHELERAEFKIDDIIDSYNVMCAGAKAAYVHEAITINKTE